MAGGKWLDLSQDATFRSLTDMRYLNGFGPTEVKANCELKIQDGKVALSHFGSACGHDLLVDLSSTNYWLSPQHLQWAAQRIIFRHLATKEPEALFSMKQLRKFLPKVLNFDVGAEFIESAIETLCELQLVHRSVKPVRYGVTRQRANLSFPQLQPLLTDLFPDGDSLLEHVYGSSSSSSSSSLSSSSTLFDAASFLSSPAPVPFSGLLAPSSPVQLFQADARRLLMFSTSSTEASHEKNPASPNPFPGLSWSSCSFDSVPVLIPWPVSVLMIVSGSMPMPVSAQTSPFRAEKLSVDHNDVLRAAALAQSNEKAMFARGLWCRSHAGLVQAPPPFVNDSHNNYPSPALYPSYPSSSPSKSPQPSLAEITPQMPSNAFLGAGSGDMFDHQHVIESQFADDMDKNG